MKKYIAYPKSYEIFESSKRVSLILQGRSYFRLVQRYSLIVAYFPCICGQVEPYTLGSPPQKLLHWVSAEDQLIHSYSSLYVTVTASPFPPQLLPLPSPLRRQQPAE